MEKMRAMVLSECAKIETKPLKITEIEKHKIERSDEILLKIEAVVFVIHNFMELKAIGNILEFQHHYQLFQDMKLLVK